VEHVLANLSGYRGKGKGIERVMVPFEWIVSVESFSKEWPGPKNYTAKWNRTRGRGYIKLGRHVLLITNAIQAKAYEGRAQLRSVGS